MPKITVAGASNALGQDPDAPFIAEGAGEPMTGVEHPADGTFSPAIGNEPEGGEESSPGTSSSTSSKSKTRSSSSTPATPPAPAPTTDSPSSPAPQSPGPSSGAPSTDGSTPGTGKGRPDSDLKSKLLD